MTTNTGNNDTIALSIVAKPTGGAFTGGSTTSVTAAGGVATFSNVAVTLSGTYTFSAADTTTGHTGYTSTGASSGTVITSGVGTKLVYNVAPPSTGTAGSPLTTFSVYVEDAYGNLVTTNTGATDTINLTANTGTINAGNSVAAIGGVATFSTTAIDLVGSYTITAADGTAGDTGFTTVTSTTPTVISPAGASQVGFVTQPPTTGTAGTALTTFTVDIEDAYGNRITSGTGSNDTITLTPSSGSITAGASATASLGLATFSSTTLTAAGSYTFTAADSTTGHTGYGTDVSTTPTVIGSAVGSKLVYNVEPPTNGVSGNALATFKVYVEDTYGNLVTTNTGYNDAITLTLATKPTGGAFSSASTTYQNVVAVNGVATFTGVAVTGGGSYTFTAADSTHAGYTSTTSTPATRVVELRSYQGNGTGTSVSITPTVTAHADPVLILISYYGRKSGGSNPACATPSGYGTNFTGAPTAVAATTYYSQTNDFFGYCAYKATISNTATVGGTYTVTEALANTSSRSVEVQVIDLATDTTATFPNSSTNSGATTSLDTNLGTFTSGSLEIMQGLNATYTSGGAATLTLPSGFSALGTATTLGSGATAFNEAAAVGYAASTVSGTLSASSNWGGLGIEVKP